MAASIRYSQLAGEAEKYAEKNVCQSIFCLENIGQFLFERVCVSGHLSDLFADWGKWQAHKSAVGERKEEVGCLPVIHCQS